MLEHLMIAAVLIWDVNTSYVTMFCPRNPLGSKPLWFQLLLKLFIPQDRLLLAALAWPIKAKRSLPDGARLIQTWGACT
eukprot:5987516-Amphidinium_carterae.1